MTVSAPNARLTTLHRADGSATYSHGGYSILGSVNGPIEVTRRDELPEEAAVEVIVRPSVGVGSPKERHLESIIHSLLRSVILTRKLPRSLIQIVLQVMTLPEESEESMSPTASTCSLPLLPHLLQTALLALLSSALPLSMTFSSILVALSSRDHQDVPTFSPTPQGIRSATSLHVFTFSQRGRCLISESSGTFSFNAYVEAYKVAEKMCTDPVGQDQDEDIMVGLDEPAHNLTSFVRSKVAEKVESEQRWRRNS
ncbi:hypothetical protein EJ05DRAFT_471682 [Pseudovirgaria hyperparasitica]|uniref:Exoribonuclease phosphorolytic domain-containing protein n=1 Tax=Pseudovirgaria hyperparasitica TaxID=470096 RepID=A0A6A6WKN9_9PEZI|nr:uncharacterized protein EJ05DRAFT_471682 [Pseudovirgaria hyperparasitica]KAF2762732.1 hypothetical protein EJ05DRAFT_471682 [Pseudovirgaria hyperparasitica]